MVFAAVDEQVGQPVAIKVIHSQLANGTALKRLRREVQAARHVHPNLVTIFDLHEQDGIPFLSMELVEGETLRQRLVAHGTLPVTEVVEIGRQVAAALAHLHGNGVLHRDVKPGNILLSGVAASAPPAGSPGASVRGPSSDPSATASRPALAVKLCDLGLARPLERGITLTDSAMLIGTPAYMAPELGLAKEPTATADINALGLSLYECLTAEVPITADTTVATLVLRQKERAPEVRRKAPECPAWLSGLLDRMLDPDPRRRPDAAEVEATLASGRQRFRFPVRRLGAVAAAAALAAAGWLAWTLVQTPATARVETAGRVVRGFDGHGRETWRYTLANPIRQMLRADLDGDGRDEILLTAVPPLDTGAGLATLGPSELVVLTVDGRVVTRASPETLATTWSYPWPKAFEMNVLPVDLDGDGYREVVVAAMHRTYFPSELFIYWPRDDRWDWVLDHPGIIETVAVAHTSEGPRLRFVAVNNPLGMLRVFGEITIPSGPPQILQRSTGACLVAPTEHVSGVGYAWQQYVLFPEGYALPRPGPGAASRAANVETVPSGESLLGAIDDLGNPLGSPLAGRNTRELRLRFFATLSNTLTANAQSLGPAAIGECVTRVRSEMAPLLDETSYRVVLALTAATAYVAAGRVDDAVATLEETQRSAPYEEIERRLANLEGLSGKLDSGLARLRGVTEHPRTQRGKFDVPILLARLAVELRDRANLSFALAALATRFGQVAMAPSQRSLEARARLWWGTSEAADEQLPATIYVPEGEAVACLVRWRRGHTRPDDLTAMQRLAAAEPAAAPEAWIAAAAVQLATGHALESVTTLDKVMASLAGEAREDFAAFQTLGLARALRCHARLAAGQAAAARHEAESLTATLTPGLLPATLVGEVMLRTGKPPRPASKPVSQ
jgi:hypothetical protein